MPLVWVQVVQVSETMDSAAGATSQIQIYLTSLYKRLMPGHHPAKIAQIDVLAMMMSQRAPLSKRQFCQSTSVTRRSWMMSASKTQLARRYQLGDGVHMCE